MNKPLLIALACFLASCGPLHHVNIKLDLVEFNKFKMNDTARLSRQKDIKSIVVHLSDGGYKETSYREGITLTAYRYFYPSGRLKSYGRTTNGFEFGKSPLYDETGYLVSVTNNDAPFKYTVNRLGAKFAFGSGINIFKEGNTITRSSEDGKPLYRLIFPINSPEINKCRRVIIDGITGKVLSDEDIMMPQRSVDN